MQETQSFFLDEKNTIGYGTTPLIGCCGFLSGFKHSFKVVIPKSITHDFIDDDSFKSWLEIMNDIGLHLKKSKARSTMLISGIQ